MTFRPQDAANMGCQPLFATMFAFPMRDQKSMEQAGLDIPLWASTDCAARRADCGDRRRLDVLAGGIVV